MIRLADGAVLQERVEVAPSRIAPLGEALATASRRVFQNRPKFGERPEPNASQVVPGAPSGRTSSAGDSTSSATDNPFGFGGSSTPQQPTENPFGASEPVGSDAATDNPFGGPSAEERSTTGSERVRHRGSQNAGRADNPFATTRAARSVSATLYPRVDQAYET